MAAMDTRHPPRFVPTLTDVVPEVEATLAAAGVQALPAEPVFKEVPAQGGDAAPTVAVPAKAPELLLAQQDLEDMAQAMQVKVMARLDEALEERLRYALADMVQLHTQALYQAIRTDVERLVDSAVHDAIAQELAHMRAKTN